MPRPAALRVRITLRKKGSAHPPLPSKASPVHPKADDQGNDTHLHPPVLRREPGTTARGWRNSESITSEVRCLVPWMTTRNGRGLEAL